MTHNVVVASFGAGVVPVAGITYQFPPHQQLCMDYTDDDVVVNTISDIIISMRNDSYLCCIHIECISDFFLLIGDGDD